MTVVETAAIASGDEPRIYHSVLFVDDQQSLHQDLVAQSPSSSLIYHNYTRFTVHVTVPSNV